MLLKNLEFSFRQIAKDRLFSFINIIGLAIGLAACTVIALFVQFELSFDRHWEKSDRLYNVHTAWTLPSGWEGSTEETPAPWKYALQTYFSEEIAATTRTIEANPTIKIGKDVSDQMVVWTDAETASMFDFSLISGNITQVLSDKRSIALSQSVALRLFGSLDILDQTMLLSVRGQQLEYRVGAIYRDLDSTSVLNIPALVLIDKADFLLENASDIGKLDHWDRVTARTYFELKDGVPIGAIETRLNLMIDTLANRLHLESTTLTPSEMQMPVITPLNKMRLYGPAGGTAATVTIYAVIAILILCIATINFINLATAKSGIRAKEVGLRKVMGASRSSIIQRYLTESFATTLIAAIIALVLVEIFLPIYNNFSALNLQLDYTNPILIALFGGTTLLVGFLSGFYPALQLSSLRPTQALKSHFSIDTIGSIKLRSLLVVFQFSITITLIVATLVVYLQRIYTGNLDPGFNKNNLLIVENLNRGSAAQLQKAFQLQVENLSMVTGSTLTTNAPTVYRTGATNVVAPSVNPEKGHTLYLNFQDHKYFKLFEVPIVAGRDYSLDHSEDLLPGFQELRKLESLERNVIINELAAKQLGLGNPQDAIGQIVTARIAGVNLTLKVTGIAANAYFRGVRKEAQPRIFFQMDRAHPLLTMRYAGSEQSLVVEIEKLWMAMFPEIPFKYTFVETALAKEFGGDEKANQTLAAYASIAIFIACLGLYGLATFAAERRFREIGIRKVVGAGVWDIVRLLVWQFSKPVLVANLIAWPLACFFMIEWLNGFPVHLDLWVLVPICFGAGMMSLLVSWSTVGSNALVVARKRPIHALRYE